MLRYDPKKENLGYINHSYLPGGTFADCGTNVAATTNHFGDLRFILNQEKYVFEPRKITTFLGFVLNSVAMTVALIPGKANKGNFDTAMILSDTSNHVSTGGPFQRKNRQTTLIILRFYLSCFFTFPILITWAEELFYAIG